MDKAREQIEDIKYALAVLCEGRDLLNEAVTKLVARVETLQTEIETKKGEANAQHDEG